MTPQQIEEATKKATGAEREAAPVGVGCDRASILTLSTLAELQMRARFRGRDRASPAVTRG